MKLKERFTEEYSILVTEKINICNNKIKDRHLVLIKRLGREDRERQELLK